MVLFWVLVGFTFSVSLAVMFSIFLLHKKSAGGEDTHDTRLPPDILRILSYILGFLLCLAGAMVELYLYYG